MTLSIAQILRISRPRFWLYLVGPYLIGYISGISNIEELLYLQFWVFLLYFLIPSNIFLYGINDLHDEDTDRFNVKKGDYEYKVTHSQQAYLQHVVLFSAVTTILVGLLANNIFISVSLFLFLFLSYAYSAPPFRFKAKPFIDSLSNSLYVVPGIIGYLLASNSTPGLLFIVCMSLWTSAMHLFSAIPDISADQRANLKTTAVILGKEKSLLLCSMLWFFFACMLVILVPLPWLYLGFLYSLIPIYVLLSRVPVEKVYKFFPLLNAVIGCIVFWTIIIVRFYII